VIQHSGSLSLVFPLCGITWPIQEIPHNSAAGFCLALAGDYVASIVLQQDESMALYGNCVSSGLDPP